MSLFIVSLVSLLVVSLVSLVALFIKSFLSLFNDSLLYLDVVSLLSLHVNIHGSSFILIIDERVLIGAKILLINNLHSSDASTDVGKTIDEWTCC